MGDSTSWRLSPHDIALGADEVHLWRAGLDGPPSLLRRFAGWLSPDERQRAERFYFQRDRNRFIAARGLLRAVLGTYLKLSPRELRFRYNTYGKPDLIPEQALQDLRFNLSHSDELALLGVTRGRRLGVDVESIRFEFTVDEIADRFFSPPELAVLRSLPAELKTQVFFNYWTRKEAYIKARGKGLSLPLDKFDVSRTPPEPIGILDMSQARRDETRWSLIEVAPAEGYAAALAVEGRDWKLECGDWCQISHSFAFQTTKRTRS